MNESDSAPRRTLQPGGSYVHAVRLNRWPAAPLEKGGVRTVANLFVEPGEYTIRCLYQNTAGKGEAVDYASKPVKVELAKEGVGAHRLGEFRENLDSFTLSVTLHPAEKGKVDPKFELYSVLLHVPALRLEPPGVGPTGKPISASARISREQAAKVVDVLGKDHFFDRASSQIAPRPDRGGRFAEFSASHGKTNPPTQLWQTLSWDLAVLQEIEAIRACVDGDAAKVLDQLLAPWAEQRKELEREEAAWGEPVEGVQARLRAAKTKVAAGERVAFDLDLRNRGDKTREALRAFWECQVEVDGVWYEMGPVVLDAKAARGRLQPGERIDRWVAVSLSEAKFWAQKKPAGREAAPHEWFTLRPGKHTVRVSFPFGKEVVPVSRPVEIEIAEGKN
jgi:hypothetical protein